MISYLLIGLFGLKCWFKIGKNTFSDQFEPIYEKANDHGWFLVEIEEKKQISVDLSRKWRKNKWFWLIWAEVEEKKSFWSIWAQAE